MANDRQINFEHDDGRNCIVDPNGTTWRYWSKDGGDSPPKAKIGWVCTRSHLRLKDHQGDSVRGDFGMPGLGSAMVDWAPTPAIAWTFDDGHRVATHSDGITIEYGDKGRFVPAVTDDARYILSILPDIIATFLEKNQKYAAVEEGYDLGDKGIIPDLNRKLGILVDRVWNEHREVGESTDEVVGDMIGHLLLFLAKRRTT
jgi:hypothetical protein